MLLELGLLQIFIKTIPDPNKQFLLQTQNYILPVTYLPC